VLSVISDQKRLVVEDSLVVSYAAVVLTATDYSPFGVGLYGRSWSEGYRYGFNGKEKDDEVKGVGNSYDFGARIHDSRLGRWLSIDPLSAEYAPISPYTFALNNPIIFVDSDGQEVIGADGKPVTYTKGENGTINWSANATEDIKTLGNILLSTENGTELWTNMSEHNREIHMHLAETGDGDKDTPAIINHHKSARIVKEKGGAIMGEIVNGAQFRKIQDGTFTEDDYTNENSGDVDIGNEYAEKNELWNETHLIVNVDNLNEYLKNTNGVKGLTKQSSEEQELKVAIANIGAEEAAHTLQNITDKGNDYEEAAHEVDAKKIAKKVANEVKKQINKEVKDKK